MASKKDPSFFDHIQKNTKVRPDELLKLANSVSKSNLKDEETVRRLIHQVAQLAGKPVSKEKEDQLVQAIIKNNVPADFASLSKMFNKN
ncbi:stage VI sporulation protein F [Alkalicoccobacillus porphyridii]|uniref:Stage VI sporulation protein F n=1 Tax=Alkalicoccobacillus porphyridii TaxID=2597270 RepID=A0A553ZZP4_9BACI|nr:stage VI sporulation protein F [Alkalicoccobacillus porphyridii]TSB46902.1 stage VI sporulation protein F [Alkalicoccobacillus porphyridii]